MVKISKTRMESHGIECIGDFKDMDNVLLVHFKSHKAREAFVEWLEEVV